jgi:hypothetical protein
MNFGIFGFPGRFGFFSLYWDDASTHKAAIKRDERRTALLTGMDELDATASLVTLRGVTRVSRP